MVESGEPIYVLHVDDEPDFLEMASIFLEREDDRLSISTAHNAAEGLETLSETVIDCIVSDYDMPNENGLEFLESVRSAHPNLPFILFTGKGSEEIASQAISRGVSDYIQKGGSETYALLANQILNSVLEYKTRQFETRTKFGDPLSLLDRIPDGFFALDTAWCFTYINERARQIFDTSPGELLGENIWEVFPEARDTIFYDHYLEAVEVGEPRTVEEYFEPWDRWYREHIYPSEAGISILLRDITEPKEREQELQRMSNFFKESERLGGLGAWEFDREGNATWTAGTRRIHGVDETFEPTVDRGIEFFHPEDRPRIESAIHQAIENGESYDIEGRLVTDEAEERWVRVRGGPHGDGETVRGFIQDITQQKERERELKDAKDQLESAIEAGDIGTWEWYIQEDELVMDPAFARRFGVNPEEARGGVSLDHFVSAIHEDDRERVREKIDAAIEECGDYEEKYRVRDESGEFRWVLARGRVDCEEDDTPVRFPGVLFDITERKQRERFLERYRLAMNHIVEPIYFLDPEGHIEVANDAFVEVVGCERNEIIGAHVGNFMSDRDLERATNFIRDLLEADENSWDTFETRIQTSSGESSLNTTWAAVLREHGEFVGSVGVILGVE